MKIKLDVASDNSERVHYNFNNLSAYVEGRVMQVKNDAVTDCHWHDDVEFMYVTSGTMHYNINGEYVTMNEGEGIFINSRQMHYGSMLAGERCGFICVIFHPVILCTDKKIEQDFVSPLVNNPAMPYLLLNEENAWCALLMDDLQECFEEYKNNLKSREMGLYSLFYHIWMLLFNNMPSSDSDTDASHSRLFFLKEMIAYIHNNYAEKITLNDIAAAGKVCQSRCCSLFKEFMHQSPFTYITSYRLSKAADMLVYSDASVTDVAMANGFSGSSYFTEMFRKKYGCTPMAYRKSYK